MILIGGPFQISFNGQTGRYFAWRDYGLQLFFPPNCSHGRILVTMSSYIPFKNQIGPKIHVVSSIYYVRTNVKHFDNAVTLHLQHCVKLKTEEDCQKLHFIIIRKNGQIRADGKFNIGHSYGTIEVTNFCYIYIVWEADRGINIRPLNDQQGESVQEGTNNSSQSNNNSSLKGTSHLSSNNASFIDTSNDNPNSVSGNSIDESHESLTQEVVSPTFVYEEMLVVPSNRSSIVDKNWSGIYSIYRNLDGWRLV